MQPLLIRTSGPRPPGGYAFRDPKTGKHYTDLHTNFQDRVREVQKDRQVNAKLYTPAELFDENIAREISEYNCRRFNNDPRFCIGEFQNVVTTIPNSAPMNVEGKVCQKCKGTLWEAIYCSTCGGRKIKGYRCVSCGESTSK